MERKPFALYLHNDDAVAANIFAQNVSCYQVWFFIAFGFNFPPLKLVTNRDFRNSMAGSC